MFNEATTLSFVSLIVNFAGMMGVILVVSGLYTFHLNGKNAQGYPIRKAIMLVISGTLLLALDPVYQTTLETFSGNDSSSYSILAVNANTTIPLQSQSAANGLWGLLGKGVSQNIVAFLYVFGLFSFVRGLLMLKDAGEVRSPGKGFLGSAMTHIFYGAGLMNIVPIMDFIAQNWNS